MNTKPQSTPDAPCHWNNSESAAWQAGFEAGRDSCDHAFEALLEALRGLLYYRDDGEGVEAQLAHVRAEEALRKAGVNV